MSAIGDNWYIDFMNPSYAVNKYMHSKGYQYVNFRNIKNIINTRIGMWKYEGLDDNPKFPMLTSSILETALFFQTNLCFAEIKALGGWFLLRYEAVGERNAYYKPTRVNLFTLSNMYIGEQAYEDIILVKDNTLDLLPILPVLEYMEKIDYIEATMEKVMVNATLPLVLVGNKKQANALKSTASKLGVPNPYIIGDDTLLDQIKSFDISVPISPLDLYDLKRKYLNECMSSLGIYYVEEKRERIVTQELVNQNDYTDFVYMNADMSRNEFIKKLNDRSGSNIKVIEAYDLNFNDGVAEETRKEFEIAKATAKGELQGNPKDFEKEKAGENNGKVL